MTQDYTLDHEWDRNTDYPRTKLSSYSSSLFENDMMGFFIKLARYKFACRLVKPGSTVVDMGCGDGVGSLFLSQHSKKTIGADIHKPIIDFCRNNYHRPNLEFMQSAGEDLIIQEPVDAVVCLDAIEHVPADVAPSVIANIARLVTRTGTLVLGTPNICSQTYASQNRIAQHYIEYGREELEQLVAPYFGNTAFFSMNDEVVHTGYHKMAWYLFLVCTSPLKPAAPGRGTS